MRTQQHVGVIEAIRLKMRLECISQASLSRKSGVAQGIISRILSHKKHPRAVTIARLLDALDMRIDGLS